MNLKKILNKNLVCLDLPGESKQEVIEAILDVIMKTGKVKDRGAALTCILDREQKMSTGVQEGIAIPHGKTEAVDELLVCVAVKKEGIDFEALDGKKSRIFIMTLSPVNRIGPHIQFLAEISKMLRHKETREKMLSAGSADELLDLILNPEKK